MFDCERHSPVIKYEQPKLYREGKLSFEEFEKAFKISKNDNRYIKHKTFFCTIVSKGAATYCMIDGYPFKISSGESSIKFAYKQYLLKKFVSTDEGSYF